MAYQIISKVLKILKKLNNNTSMLNTRSGFVG